MKQIESENPNLSKFISKYLKSQTFEYQGMNVKFTDVFANPELENTSYFITISVDGNENNSFIPHFLLEKIDNIIMETLNHFYGEKSQDLSYEREVLYNNKVFLTDRNVVISKENLSKIYNQLQKYLTIFRLKGQKSELMGISLKYTPSNRVEFGVRLRKLPGPNSTPLPLNAFSLAMVEFTHNLNLGQDFDLENENGTEIFWIFN